MDFRPIWLRDSQVGMRALILLGGAQVSYAAAIEAPLRHLPSFWHQVNQKGWGC